MANVQNRPTFQLPMFPRLAGKLWKRITSRRSKYLNNRLAIYLMDLHAYLNGYRFKLATTEAQRQQAYQLRYQIYKKADYLSVDNNTDNQITDQYDDASAIFLAYHHGQCVGTLRLTHLDGSGSNTQDYFNISFNRDPRTVVDIGKFVVASSQRSQARTVACGLVRTAYVYSMQNNIQVWLGCAPRGLIRSFRDFLPAYILPQEPPTEQNLINRNRRSGYFQKHGDKIKPFEMLMAEVNGLDGLYKLWWPLAKAYSLQMTKRLWQGISSFESLISKPIL